MEVDHIGLAIREARHRRGWSQAYLGKAAGIPQSHLARVEAGADVYSSTIQKILKALDLDLQVVPSMRKLFMEPPEGSRLAAAREYGVDLGQLYSGMAMSPNQRLEQAAQNAIGISELMSARR